ncbi:MAG: MaoC family dehydratase, partial [Gemmatimonadetes bacterium]|nr:MaoC family dehydratase [Gemmatimonadota bacterium]
RTFREGRPVPPMAVIASGLGKVIDALGLTGGTVHAAQEVEFLRPVLSGERVYAEAELTGSSVRRGALFATILTRFVDSAGRPVANALSSIVVPVEDEG